MSRLRQRTRAADPPPRTEALDLEALYRRDADALLVFLARRTADPQIALDLWAETFAQAHEARASFRGATDAEARGWLFGIGRRQLAQFYRRGTIERRALDRLELERPPATPEVLAEIEHKAELAAMRRELREALSELSPGTRDAVQLRVVDELDYRTVAQRLGITEQAARVRVSRGLAALSDLLHPSTAKAGAA
ncbi:MAG: RNA polymerase sigma factor [Solirubrobacteraceae bacterium]|nr:RNA polymerase sigma factor [Patulibacter sp.]